MSTAVDQEQFTPETGPRYQSKAELEALFQDTDIKLRELDADLQKLWELRHENFTVGEVIDTDELDEEGNSVRVFKPSHAEDDSLYSDIDPAYNSHIYRDDIGVRKGGTLEYHDIRENYDGKHEDDPDQNEREYAYRQEILRIGQKYGFVADKAGKSENELDRYYTIIESKLAPIDEPVEAIVVPGAAGKSNVVPIRDAIRNIQSGAVKTDKIVLAGCDRPSFPHENGNVQAFGTNAGETEIESMMFAFRDIIAQDAKTLSIDSFDDAKPELHKVPYGHELVATTWRSKVLINGQEVEAIAVSAPYDPTRVEREKGLARANTDETLYASIAVLPEPGATILIESHDTWGPAQAVTSQEILGLQAGKKTITTNALYDDRVLETEHGIDIRAPEQVVDEIQKLHRVLTRLRTKISTRLEQSENFKV